MIPSCTTTPYHESLTIVTQGKEDTIMVGFIVGIIVGLAVGAASPSVLAKFKKEEDTVLKTPVTVPAANSK